jgi:hypothetical protein
MQLENNAIEIPSVLHPKTSLAGYRRVMVDRHHDVHN